MSIENNVALAAFKKEAEGVRAGRDSGTLSDDSNKRFRRYYDAKAARAIEILGSGVFYTEIAKQAVVQERDDLIRWNKGTREQRLEQLATLGEHLASEEQQQLEYHIRNLMGRIRRAAPEKGECLMPEYWMARSQLGTIYGFSGVEEFENRPTSTEDLRFNPGALDLGVEKIKEAATMVRAFQRAGDVRRLRVMEREYMTFAPEILALERWITQYEQIMNRETEAILGNVSFMILDMAQKRLSQQSPEEYDLDYCELVQEGLINAWKALDSCKPGRGKVTTYLYAAMRNAITRSMAEQTREIRLPFRIVQSLWRIEEATYVARNRNLPLTDDQIAEVVIELNPGQYDKRGYPMDANKVRFLRSVDYAIDSLGLELLYLDDGTVEDTIEGESERHACTAAYEELQQGVAALLEHTDDPKTQAILERRYGFTDGHFRSHLEIVDLDGIPLSTVGGHLRRGMSQIREHEEELAVLAGILSEFETRRDLQESYGLAGITEPGPNA
ncbi:MAG: sigma factor [archaeon]